MLVEATRWKRVEDPRITGLGEGKPLRVMIGDQAICILRMDGILRALADRCPHQGMSFQDGWCEDGLLVCPWHRMRFDPVTGRNRHGATPDVPTYPLEERADGVYVGLPYRTMRLFGRALW